MAGILLQKNKIECFVGKYFEHLKEPDTTDDISQMVYSKAKRLEGAGSNRGEYGRFCSTMRMSIMVI
jgi:hypothetical protein